MSIKPILNDPQALNNKSLDLFCDELTANKINGGELDLTNIKCQTLEASVSVSSSEINGYQGNDININNNMNVNNNIDLNNNDINNVNNLQLSTLNNELLSVPQSSSVFTLNQGAINYDPLPSSYTYYYQFSGDFNLNLDISTIEQGKYDGQTIYIGIVGPVGNITIKSGIVGAGVPIDCGGVSPSADKVITPASLQPLSWCRLTYSSNYNNLGTPAWCCSLVQQ